MGIRWKYIINISTIYNNSVHIYRILSSWWFQNKILLRLSIKIRYSPYNCVKVNEESKLYKWNMDKSRILMAPIFLATNILILWIQMEILWLLPYELGAHIVKDMAQHKEN